ncbi:unnamed protein product [Prorocentrum cordatum]|uniref:Secreted protein n=1 Tax=Prorocentrum cordatum TaxID=2364126 RepID=A0ABN9QPS8_9DINO|nr:unnamed protein product [Polarella glacialis]
MEPRSASSLSLSLSFCISLPGVPAACEGQESSRVGGLGRPVPRPSARSICLVRRLGLMPRPAPAAVGSQFFSKAVEFQAPRGSREGPAPGRADFSRCQACDMRQLLLRCWAIASRTTARCENGRRVGLALEGPRHRSIRSFYTSRGLSGHVSAECVCMRVVTPFGPYRSGCVVLKVFGGQSPITHLR